MAETIETGEGITTILKAPGDGAISLHGSVAALKKAREEAYNTPTEAPSNPPEAPSEAPDAASSPPVPPSEPPQAADDAAPIGGEDPYAAPGETTEAQPEAELPPIAPPRSWPKEEKERFKTFPRETQEYLATQAQDRERAFTRSQQEAAEQRKQYETQRQQAEQVRAQYEQALPQMVAAMNAQMMGEFADIRTWADKEKLAQEDPFRYQRLQLAEAKVQAAQQELAVASQRQQQEIGTKWKEFHTKEDALFAQNAPEMADTSKAQALRTAVKKTLDDLGFKDDEIKDAWEGRTGVALRDHRVQLLIRDATLWRQAQAKAKQVTKAPVPPVQKPGTIRPRGSDNEAAIAAVQKQLETASGAAAVRLATQLTQLRRAVG